MIMAMLLVLLGLILGFRTYWVSGSVFYQKLNHVKYVQRICVENSTYEVDLIMMKNIGAIGPFFGGVPNFLGPFN